VKLNGTHQLLVFADDVNILGGSIYTIKNITEALVVTRKETGLEVNAEKTKNMVMSQDDMQDKITT
jgi:hypothetical protein